MKPSHLFFVAAAALLAAPAIQAQDRPKREAVCDRMMTQQECDRMRAEHQARMREHMKDRRMGPGRGRGYDDDRDDDRGRNRRGMRPGKGGPR